MSRPPHGVEWIFCMSSIQKCSHDVQCTQWLTQRPLIVKWPNALEIQRNTKNCSIGFSRVCLLKFDYLNVGTFEPSFIYLEVKFEVLRRVAVKNRLPCKHMEISIAYEFLFSVSYLIGLSLSIQESRINL